MPARRLTIATLLAGVMLPATPALADSVIVADPSARNVSAYASTAAWSRLAADNTFRLVVMGADGVPSDAAVRPSSVPFEPDIGPTKANGRMVVYSRCKTASSTAGCDVYGYDVGTRVERRIAAVSSAGRSEVGPSYFKGVLAFGRRGARGGLFVKAPGKPTRRVWNGVVNETDVSGSRVIATNAGVVRISERNGDHPRTLRRGTRGEEAETVVTSPSLARYRAFWMVTSHEFADEGPASSIVETVSVRSRARRVGRVNRPFAGAIDSVALGTRSVPQLFSGSPGISRIDPPLVIPF